MGAYRAIGENMRSRKFNVISNYISTTITSLQNQENIFYTMFHKPVYRGCKMDISNLQVGDIKSWPTFTSTSKSIKVAK
jgi:hypothetical protein